MKTRSAFLLFALFCCILPSAAADRPVEVSMIQLISNPKEYDGKIVAVTGFLSLKFEASAIYLHQDDCKHGISKNGLWFEGGDDMRKKKADFDQKYVTVIGTFNAEMKGHYGAYSGGIEKITKCICFEVPYKISDITNTPSKN